jgi:hypothetical protein
VPTEEDCCDEALLGCLESVKSGLHDGPKYDSASAIAYASTQENVETVMIGGRIVTEDRRIKTIDETRVLDNVSRRPESLQNRIWHSLIGELRSPVFYLSEIQCWDPFYHALTRRSRPSILCFESPIRFWSMIVLR